MLSLSLPLFFLGVWRNIVNAVVVGGILCYTEPAGGWLNKTVCHCVGANPAAPTIL